MTNAISCPEFALLSQFLDHELGPTETQQISRHVSTCHRCREQIKEIQQAEEDKRADFFTLRPHTALSASSDDCLEPEIIAAYAQGILSSPEEQQAEAHLFTCDACLNEVNAVVRAASTVAREKLEAVPTLLAAQVAAQWQPSAIAADTLSLPRIVIQVAERGLRLIERHLVSPLLDVQEVLTPLPAALRQGKSRRHASGLRLRLRTEQAEMAVQVEKIDDGVVVKLTLVGAAQEELARRRIYFRQGKRAILSEMTNERGELFIPFLSPGSYQVSCHEIHTTFELDLRP
jgi:anti-sigma factor RsiW